MGSFAKTLRANAKANPGATWLWRALRAKINPHERAVRRVQTLSPDLLLQPSHYTSTDRYPWLFHFLRERLSSQ
jgi:hypothetical protein